MVDFVHPKDVIGVISESEPPCHVPALLSAWQCGSAPYVDDQCPQSYLLQPCTARNVSSVTTLLIRVLQAAGAPLEQAGQGLPDWTIPPLPAREQGRLRNTVGRDMARLRRQPADGGWDQA